MPREGFGSGRRDYAIALALSLGYVALLLLTTNNLGYARDEGFYFWAAQSYENWFKVLLEQGRFAFERETVDRFWSANHEHPALMKSLFALSHHYLYESWQLFANPGTSYRFPGMLVSSLAIGVVYLWGARIGGRAAGIIAALLLGFMPRVFYHSHLACFDMPVAAIWLITTYAYFRSLYARGFAWAITTGLLYGLLLNTKHNSWLLPGALVLHLLLTRGRHIFRELRAGRVAVPAAFYAMILLGPPVFYLGWPWIWYDTGPRLAEYIAFHTGHEYYNMEFLGDTYWKSPMPRLYAWLMTFATVPAITLILFGIGLCAAISRAYGIGLSDFWAKQVRGVSPAPRAPVTVSSKDERYSAEVLWLLCLLISYAPWLSSNTPIFGGTKHWITAYPFLCLFAGLGFSVVYARLKAQFAPGLWRERALLLAVAGAVIVGPVVMTVHAHPWQLSFYTPAVGGSPGAASLGLNRTFWGYTTGALQAELNARARGSAVVFVHDTAIQSFDMLRKDGKLRADLYPTLAIPSSQLALYHHEPHMLRVDYQIWVDYGTLQPSVIGDYDGVPVVWLYERKPR